MSARELMKPHLWKGVANKLEGEALKWWTEHQQDLLAIGQDDVEDIAEALAHGDTIQAKIAIVGNMDREEWKAYRNGTTAKLRQSARSRAKILNALGDLGTGLAEVLGKALVAALTG